ncbi:MAG: hypothetical protein AB8I08_30870 [Sandaracinaceae bacterium]
MDRWKTPAGVLALLLLVPSAGAAQDGAYGRLDGDLTLEAGLGGGVTFDNDHVSGAGTLDLRARYLDVAGLVIGLDVRPDRQIGSVPLGGGSRVLLMADVRPLWLARFFLGATVGDRWVDLMIDSLGVELGVALTPIDEDLGAAFAVGFGVDLPLVFFGDGIEGLALRLNARHVAALATDRFGPAGARNDWIAGGSLVFRFQASTGLPGWERPRYRTRPR